MDIKLLKKLIVEDRKIKELFPKHVKKILKKKKIFIGRNI